MKLFAWTRVLPCPEGFEKKRAAWIAKRQEELAEMAAKRKREIEVIETASK